MVNFNSHRKFDFYRTLVRSIRGLPMCSRSRSLNITASILALVLVLIPMEGKVSGTRYETLSLEQLVARSPIILVARHVKTTTLTKMAEGEKYSYGPFVTEMYEFSCLEVLRDRNQALKHNKDPSSLTPQINVHEAYWQLHWRMHQAYVQEGVSKWLMLDRYESGKMSDTEPVIIFLNISGSDDSDEFEFVATDAYESIIRREEVMKLIRDDGEERHMN